MTMASLTIEKLQFQRQNSGELVVVRQGPTFVSLITFFILRICEEEAAAPNIRILSRSALQTSKLQQFA